ncbi:MAG: HDOD domain-containing protein, partial [Phycisphaerales bacterium]|nr:HDOD domain-containing protein [Phycisphaerales bacterium]
MTTSAFEELLLCPNLPTLPTVAVEILALTRDPNVKMKDIERLVQTDQGLASRVLRTVNSSLYSLRKPCSTIERALTYLGLNAVKSLVLGFSLVDVSKGVGEDDGFDMSTYWERVIYSSAGGRIIAVATRSCDPDEAFTCGIFQDIGMLAAIVGMSDDYVPLLMRVGERHDRLPAAEQDAFGFDHAEVGEALARKWKMPENIAACVGNHHDPDAAPKEYAGLVRSVYLGGLLAEALNNENAASLVRTCDSLLYKWFGKIDASMEELLNRISESAADFAKVLDKKVGRAT